MPELTRNVSAMVHYRREAEASRALLLFNGATLPLEFWDPVVERLLPDSSVIRFDARNAGRTRFSGIFTLADIAADADAVLDAVGIEQVAVAGHAWGGRAAQVFARDFPHRVNGLIVVGTGGQFPPTMPAADTQSLRRHALAGDRASWEAALERCYCAAGFRDREPDAFAALSELLWNRRPNGNATWQSQACPSDSYWGTSRHRALLIYGTEDRYGTPDNAADLQQRLPNARLVMIESAGHFIVREAPEAVAREIRAFLDHLEDHRDD